MSFKVKVKLIVAIVSVSCLIAFPVFFAAAILPETGKMTTEEIMADPHNAEVLKKFVSGGEIPTSEVWFLRPWGTPAVSQILGVSEEEARKLQANWEMRVSYVTRWRLLPADRPQQASAK